MRSLLVFKTWILDKNPRIRFRRILLSVALIDVIALFMLFYGNMALACYFSPTRTNPAGHVVILTTSWCPFCHSLQQALNASGLPYDTIDIERDWKARYAHYSTKQRGIPVTVIGNKIVGGGLTAQLAAIRRLCEQTNRSGRYDCGRLTTTGY